MSTKHWYQSHIMWVAILTGIASAIGIFASAHPDVAWIGLVQSVILMILRSQSTQPIA